MKFVLSYFRGRLLFFRFSATPCLSQAVKTDYICSDLFVYQLPIISKFGSSGNIFTENVKFNPIFPFLNMDKLD